MPFPMISTAAPWDNLYLKSREILSDTW
jgi:hypothetical protein